MPSVVIFLRSGNFAASVALIRQDTRLSRTTCLTPQHSSHPYPHSLELQILQERHLYVNTGSSKPPDRTASRLSRAWRELPDGRTSCTRPAAVRMDVTWTIGCRPSEKSTPKWTSSARLGNSAFQLAAYDEAAGASRLTSSSPLPVASLLTAPVDTDFASRRRPSVLL